MRCALVLTCALLVGAGNAAAASVDPKLVSSGIPHDMLYGLSFEGQNGITVGDYGLVQETTDGGKSWTRQAKAPTNLGLLSVVRKQGRCIAGGQSGLILTAPDCKQWAASASASKARILGVGVNASGTAFAVGGFGAILKSADWGKTWQPVVVDWAPLTPDGAEPHLYDVNVADNGEVTLVGEFELILRSKDSGATWQPLHKGTRSLFSLKVLENGEIYAVGQEGIILKSADIGKTWVEQKSGTTSVLTGVWARPSGQAMVSGIYTILSTTDAGKTWQMDASKLAKVGSYQGVFATDDGNGKLNAVLVGSGGSILTVHR